MSISIWKVLKETIPNLLTISRFPLGLLAAALFTNHYFELATLVFLLIQFTDFLDGRLARRWNTISEFGKTADLLADKFVTMMILFILSTQI